MHDFFFSTDLINAIPRGSRLDILMFLLSWLGEEGFFTVALPLLFWSGRSGLSRVLSLSFFSSVFINQIAKNIFDLPRPAMENLLPEVQRLAILYGETSSGLPSGHASSAFAFYFLLFLLAGRRRLRFAALAVALLMPFSRLYLGVHFPGDVITGSLMGASCALFSLYWSDHFFAFFSAEKLRTLLVITLSALVLFLLPAKMVAVSGGAFCGFVTAAMGWNDRLRHFDTLEIPGRRRDHIIRIAILLVSLLALRALLKMILPGGIASDFIRYFFLVYLAFGAAPAYLFGSRTPAMRTALR